MWGNLPDTLFHCLIKYLFINWLPFSMELALDWNWASLQKLEALEMNNVWPGIGSVMLFLSAYSDPSSNISLFLHQFFINFSISNKCIPRDQTMLQYHLSSQKKKKKPTQFPCSLPASFTTDLRILVCACIPYFLTCSFSSDYASHSSSEWNESHSFHLSQLLHCSGFCQNPPPSAAVFYICSFFPPPECFTRTRMGSVLWTAGSLTPRHMAYGRHTVFIQWVNAINLKEI